MNLYITMTDKAIESKVNQIIEQIELINTMPGNVIDYITATQLTKNLVELKEYYIKEQDRRKGLGITK